MTIENFKQLPLHEKLLALRRSGELLGPYERNDANGGTKTPGDIYAVEDFYVYLSEDESIVVVSRRNPLPAE
ncbi:MAG: hypothetical protein ABI861_05380 [Panacibacter sp.]